MSMSPNVRRAFQVVYVAAGLALIGFGRVALGLVVLIFPLFGLAWPFVARRAWVAAMSPGYRLLLPTLVTILVLAVGSLIAAAWAFDVGKETAGGWFVVGAGFGLLVTVGLVRSARRINRNQPLQR